MLLELLLHGRILTVTTIPFIALTGTSESRRQHAFVFVGPHLRPNPRNILFAYPEAGRFSSPLHSFQGAEATVRTS